MLTVRLSIQIEKELDAFCERKRITKSQAIKEALAMYMENDLNSASPYELGADLFGQEGNGQPDSSATYKKRLKTIISEKHTY